MKRIVTFLTMLWLMLATTTWAQTAMASSIGDASESNPYQIANLENLNWLSQSDSVWSNSFAQAADVDAADTKSWSSNSGFSTIGNETIEFTGSYNGQSHLIQGCVFLA